MKSFIITRILRFIGGKLDGYKTAIGGLGLILMGIVGIIGIMFPDLKLVDWDLEKSLTFVTMGFAALGLGGKIEKLKNKIVNIENVKEA